MVFHKIYSITLRVGFSRSI